MTNKQSQNDAILQHLQSGKHINPIQALNNYGCFRLGARIYNLKKMGYKIRTRIIISKGGKHFAQYSLMDTAQQP